MENRKAHMLAIPVFQSRIAPVFNWCSRALVLPLDAAEGSKALEVDLGGACDPFERLRMLRGKGVTLLICGAISPELLGYAGHLDISVICGVAGEIKQVIRAYRCHKLDEPLFRLPGCRRERCYRSNAAKADKGGDEMPGGPAGQGQGGGGRGAGQGRGKRMGGFGGGPGGACKCPDCGTTAPHERGIPCSQVQCPKCGRTMTRKQED